MADNSTLPAAGDIVEDLDTFGVSGVHSKRQVITVAPRDLSGADSIGGLTETAPATDTASSGLNGRLQRIAQRITSLIALLPTALGASGGFKVDIVGVTAGNTNGPKLPSGCAPVTAVSGAVQWETVAASASDQAMGATGAAGDYLESLLCIVGTAATSLVQIKDGAGSLIDVLPNNVGAGVGTYPIPIGLVSLNGAWKITTGAGVKVIATGNFT